MPCRSRRVWFRWMCAGMGTRGSRCCRWCAFFLGGGIWETRAAAIGVTAGALAALAGCWAGGGGWGAILSGLALTWPLFVAAGLLFAAIRTRLDREREASRLHRHTRANRMELEASEVCGCIACERIYFPSEIVRWARTGRRCVRTAGWMRWWGRRRGFRLCPGCYDGLMSGGFCWVRGMATLRIPGVGDVIGME